jgi:predicted nucleic acid-binding Zn ribbon protein
VCADDEPVEPVPPPPGDQGRRLLDRARRAAPLPSRRRRRRVDPQDQPWSGAGADARDPAVLGESLTALARERKWEDTLRTAGIPARWEEIVGVEIAAHCRPERLEDATLTCVAESTAWATQIRMLSRSILERLGEAVGPGVVRRIQVHGPSAPDWRHGRLRVTGRGPRDTYG